jgi:hypothetical protein
VKTVGKLHFPAFPFVLKLKYLSPNAKLVLRALFIEAAAHTGSFMQVIADYYYYLVPIVFHSNRFSVLHKPN